MESTERARVGDIRAKIRATLASGGLPSETPKKVWVGKGTNRP